MTDVARLPARDRPSVVHGVNSSCADPIVQSVVEAMGHELASASGDAQ